MIVVKGKYHVTVSTNKVHFSLTLERSITILKGESATGKTTLIKILTQSQLRTVQSINQSVVPHRELRVLFENDDWDYILGKNKDMIIFVDEDVSYAFNHTFLEMVKNSGSYIVIISRRKPLVGMNFAISSILQLKKTHKNGEITFNKSYPIYENESDMIGESIIITEDSKGGFDIISNAFKQKVIGAGGNTKVYEVTIKGLKEAIQVNCIVDSSAFGAYIDQLITLCEDYDVVVFAPESMEFLLLGLPIFERVLKDELDRTWAYCESSKYISWEPYYTDLLNEKLAEVFIGKQVTYTKSSVPKVFFQQSNLEKVKLSLKKYKIMG